MFRQIMLPPVSIASCSSVRLKRGLVLQSKLQHAANGLKVAMPGPGCGSTLSGRGLSVYISNGSFDLVKKVGMKDVRRSTLGPGVIIVLGVPYRTFKTRRSVEMEEARNPSVFARIRNNLFPPTPATTKARVAPEKLNEVLKDRPPSEADNIKIAFTEAYIAANPNPNIPSGGSGGNGGHSRIHRWLRAFPQLLEIASSIAFLLLMFAYYRAGYFHIDDANGHEVQPEDIKVTFSDVKGVDEAKSELQDVVQFLRNPDKFVQLGGKLPKGVLLVGPPGTGKTLLARAVAGEAGVPFFHAAGPEFDEIFVGQGARRIRNLFEAAKKKAPCVVFIDEIDSVGKKRSSSSLHPHANQTINQLLSEMDGFRPNERVIVLGATNRLGDLDKALLRSGRFDVEVQVPSPELDGRRDILELYLSKVKRGIDVDADILARRTIGLTGADLENMVNQATLRAAIDGAGYVSSEHLEFALDKILMGAERKSRVPDKQTNWITAYHESGHALVAHYTKEADPVHKLTILSRGSSLGHTAYIPEREQYTTTRAQLLAELDAAMGGRAAEELIFGTEKVTTGATSDLEKATSIAMAMVKYWGMSENFGLRTVVDIAEVGPATAELIDKEIKRLLQESYERAKKILREHPRELQALAEALMKYETLDADAYKAIIGKACKTHENSYHSQYLPGFS